MSNELAIACIVAGAGLGVYGYIGILAAIMGGWRAFFILAGMMTFLFACGGLVAFGAWQVSS